MNQLYTIPIASFSKSEDVKFTVFGIKRTFYKVIRNWLLTDDGQRFWNNISQENCNAEFRTINAFCCLSVNFKYPALNQSEVTLFSYKPEQKNDFLMRTILRITGIDNDYITKVFNYLKNFDPTIHEQLIIKQFTNIKIQLEIHQSHKSVSLFRKVGNEELKKFYALRKKYERVIPIGERRNKIEIHKNQRWARHYIFVGREMTLKTLYDLRTSTITNMIKTIIPKTQVNKFIIYQCIDKQGYKLVSLDGVLRNNVLLKSTTDLPSLTFNDKDGGLTSALLSYYRQMKCINISYNYVDPLKIPSFVELERFYVTESDRIDLDLSRLSMADIIDVECRSTIVEWIKAYYINKLSIIVLNFSPHLSERISFLHVVNIIVKEFSTLLHEKGTVIIRITTNIPNDLCESLKQLLMNFGSVQVLNSVVSTRYFIDLYIICYGILKPSYNEIVAYDQFISQLTSIVSKYSEDSVQDLLWDEENDFQDLIRLIKTYSRRSGAWLKKLFQILYMKLMPYEGISNYPIWLNKIVEVVQSEINLIEYLLIQLISPGKETISTKYITKATQLARLLIETAIIKTYFVIFQDSVSIQKGIFECFSTQKLSIQDIIHSQLTLLRNHVEDIQLLEIIGTDWINNDFDRYYCHCMTFVFWFVMRFLTRKYLSN